MTIGMEGGVSMLCIYILPHSIMKSAGIYSSCDSFFVSDNCYDASGRHCSSTKEFRHNQGQQHSMVWWRENWNTYYKIRRLWGPEYSWRSAKYHFAIKYITPRWESFRGLVTRSNIQYIQ